MKSHLRKKSLFGQLLLFFVSLSLLPILIYDAYTSYKLSDSIQKANAKYENLACMHIAQSIDNWMKTCEQETFLYINQDAVQSYLRSKSDNEELYDDYRLSMIRVWAGNPDLADVAFCTRNGRIDSMHLNNGLEGMSTGRIQIHYIDPIILEALMSKDATNIQWFSSPVFDYADDTSAEHVFKHTFALCRKVIDINTGDTLGVLVWHYRVDSVADRYADIASEHNCVILVDQEGRVINPNGLFSSIDRYDESVFSKITDNNGSFSVSMNGERYFLSYSVSRATGWTVISYTPWSFIMQPIAEINAMLLRVLIILVVIVIAVSFIYASIIVRPIKDLTMAIESIDFDHLRPREMIITENEIGRLTRCFYDMCVRIERLICQNETNNKLLRDAEIRALQSQINPHFLYNTLDNIIWIAKAHGEKEIEVMLINLSRFYRISLSNGMAEIPFSKELELLRYYISLLITRESHKRFKVVYEIAPETLNVMFPKIILQPLVENTIKHGFRDMDRPGQITIRSKIEGEYMLVQVIDNGLGFQLDENGCKQHGKPFSQGYGIANVNARLKQLYNNVNALQYSDAPGGGTVASIRIPIKTENHED